MVHLPVVRRLVGTHPLGERLLVVHLVHSSAAELPRWSCRHKCQQHIHEKGVKRPGANSNHLRSRTASDLNCMMKDV